MVFEKVTSGDRPSEHFASLQVPVLGVSSPEQQLNASRNLRRQQACFPLIGNICIGFVVFYSSLIISAGAGTVQQVSLSGIRLAFARIGVVCSCVRESNRPA